MFRERKEGREKKSAEVIEFSFLSLFFRCLTHKDVVSVILYSEGRKSESEDIRLSRGISNRRQKKEEARFTSSWRMDKIFFQFGDMKTKSSAR
jgi:hypothetical protein